MTVKNIVDLIWLSIVRPEEACPRILAFNLSRDQLWGAIALVSVLGSLMTGLAGLAAGGASLSYIPVGPFLLAIFQAIILVLLIFISTKVGHWFGGTGSLTDAAHLMIWLQVVMLGVQIIQLVLIAVVPILAVLLSPISIGIFLWVLSSFVAILHGFQSRFMVFLMVIVTGFAAIFAISIILTLLGFVPPQGLTDV